MRLARAWLRNGQVLIVDEPTSALNPAAEQRVFDGSRLGVRGLAQGARLISALPAGPGRALLRLATKTARLYNSMAVEDHSPYLVAAGSASTAPTPLPTDRTVSLTRRSTESRPG